MQHAPDSAEEEELPGSEDAEEMEASEEREELSELSEESDEMSELRDERSEESEESELSEDADGGGAPQRSTMASVHWFSAGNQLTAITLPRSPAQACSFSLSQDSLPMDSPDGSKCPGQTILSTPRCR